MSISYKDLESLYRQIQGPIELRTIEYNLKQNQSLWKQKYDVIKDGSWPSCDSMEEFDCLPLHIKQECEEQHKFSPGLWRQAIVDDAYSKFMLPPNQRQQKIIKDNLDMIKDKSVIDFACHTGGYSFAAWQAGARSVLGFDIRDNLLTLAAATADYLQVPAELVQFVKCDIHDYESVNRLCQGMHTALIPGVMYHIHDHYQVLAVVAKAGIENVIIETQENSCIIHSKEPLIWWRTEPTFQNNQGWNNNNDTVLIGYPNLSWFELTMSMLGYDLRSTQQRSYLPSKNHGDEFSHVRSVHVFKKRQKNDKST